MVDYSERKCSRINFYATGLNVISRLNFRVEQIKCNFAY